MSRFVLACGLLLLPAPRLAADLRTSELVRLECASELGRRDLTLFGNGTVRRRDDATGELALGEMTPEELEVFVGRLGEFDMGRLSTRYRRGVAGDWVDLCELVLDLDGEGDELPTYYRFGPFDALQSPLGTVVDTVRELEVRVAVISDERLPSDYVPRPGDVLRDGDGARYRVVGWTGDRRGIEVQGLDQPLTIYVGLEDLAGRFAAIVSRRGER